MPHTSRHALLLLAVAVYCLLVLPRMLTYGMFLDGITYASIARNMAENYGSFWRPYYTATVGPLFYEHPPLGFWLQAWAYRLCGDVVYVETLWGFGAGALILIGLGSIWRCHRPQGSALAGAWFPVLLLVIIPMTPWILSNNMLENTMTVFVMASVYSSLASLKEKKPFLSLLYGLLSGLNTFLAFLVKGPVALFTLIVPVIFIIKREEKFSKILLTNFCVVFAFLVSMVVILTVSDESRSFFGNYFGKQIMDSLYGKREVSVSRFNMLYAVCREIVVPLILSGLLTFFIYRLRKSTIRSINYRLALYYLCIALMSSLPLLVSPKQRRWYVFPSLPFYVLAIAAVFNDIALEVEQWISQHKKVCSGILKCSILIFPASLLLMFLGKNYVGRYADFYNDFSRQPLRIEERAMLSVYPNNLEIQWSLVANMQRAFKASLTKTSGHSYVLSTTEYKNSEAIPSMYKLFHPEHPEKYILFKLKD